MFLYALLTFPTATNTIQEASAWANPWLEEFWPLVYIAVGIFTFAIMIRWLTSVIRSSISDGFSTIKSSTYGSAEREYAKKHPGYYDPYLHG